MWQTFEYFLIVKRGYSKWDACLRITNDGDVVKREYMEYYKMTPEGVNDEYFHSGKYGLYLPWTDYGYGLRYEGICRFKDGLILGKKYISICFVNS